MAARARYFVARPRAVGGRSAGIQDPGVQDEAMAKANRSSPGKPRRSEVAPAQVPVPPAERRSLTAGELNGLRLFGRRRQSKGGARPPAAAAPRPVPRSCARLLALRQLAHGGVGQQAGGEELGSACGTAPGLLFDRSAGSPASRRLFSA